MAGGLDAGKYFCAFRPGGKCFSLDIPFYRTSEHNIGVVRLIVNPHVLCCFLRWSLTEVPSLHRHYPASAVLRTSPPPHTAWPVSHEMPVGYDRTTARVSRVAAGPFCLHAVAITPAGLMNPIRSYCFHQRRPSPITRWVGSCINRFEACLAFIHVTACMLAESPKRPFTPQAPTASFPPPPLRLLPGGANPVPGRDFHPQSTTAFSRRT
jgi:hypothetical protein